MENKRRGLRCRICTGCGLCPGVTPPSGQAEGMHVLGTEGGLPAGEGRPLHGGGRRLAVADIGTTTIAMLLYGEDGTVEDRYLAVNPQTVYGADVLSRIQAAADPAKAADMTEMVREALRQGILRFRRRLVPGQELCLVYAANTTMSYLLQGIDVRELGQAPFLVSHPKPADMELEGVSCFGFPSFSAFVGGDILAGVLSCGMAEQEKLTLLIDLGTNGEMVLGNGRRRIACATAAGPAFEGGPNRGVWGADMVRILAALKREGLMDGTGLLAEEFFEKGVRVGNVLVTQGAVRAVQLAKAAVSVGTEVLLEKYGADASQIEKAVLAGGFGYYLRPADAAEIGMLPPSLAHKAVTGGNTALGGCLAAGRRIFAGGREALEALLDRTVAETEIVNLACEERFEKKYIESMNF